MSTLHKIRIGVFQELRLYKYHPNLLFKENTFIIISFLIALGLSIYVSVAKDDRMSLRTLALAYTGLVITNSLASAFEVLLKVHRDKQSKFRQFLFVIYHQKDILISFLDQWHAQDRLSMEDSSHTIYLNLCGKICSILIINVG